MLKNFTTFEPEFLYFLAFLLYNKRMNLREKTKPIKLGDIQIGSNNKIAIQSMCDIKTSNVDLVVKEINECHELGPDLMRVSVLFP